MKEGFDALVDHFLDGGFFLEEAVEFLESRLIKEALLRAQGNQSAASKALGIHRNTMLRKMKDFDLKPMARVAARPAGKRKSS